MRIALALSLWLGLSNCLAAADRQPASSPSVVRVSLNSQGWLLTRNGQPYVIHGVGGDGSKKLLADVGGNSVRTWGLEKLDQTLEEAQKLGLSVTVGIWLGHERHGFNYNDADQIAKQAETVRTAVLRYKDHPAVLIWALGNEMEGYGKGDNAAIWSTINNLASLVKKLDPNHPTMTVVAEIGGDRVRNIHRLCPEIDVVGINSYAGAASIPKRYREAGGTKPYILTEFGPPGSWESSKNAWGAPLELSSTEKAAVYRQSYQQAVTGAAGLCLGSYAFVWGHKQEATATWFGLLLPDGSRLAAIDELATLWTGKPVTNRCPSIDSLTPKEVGELDPGAKFTAKLATSDPEKDSLKVEWILQADPLTQGVGGDAESSPPIFPEAIIKSGTAEAEIRMPAGGGGYRLFAVVRDSHGGAAIANLPLFVKGPPTPIKSRVAKLPFVVYDEATREKAPYAPANWMGNTKALKLDEACTTLPHSGKTCLKFEYSAKDQWAGVVWADPANDWGDKPGGWDLTGAKKLTIWARGEHGGEVIGLEFGIFGKEKKFSDTGKAKKEGIKLTTSWQAISIDLTGQDLSRIKSGIVITFAGSGEPMTIYLDDCVYE
ncbi:MAG: hypothetical protein JWM11_4612 [Planctomycetaceae bacterium]|nr:hypothetical protein [Planctomycetaceae bacterium]